MTSESGDSVVLIYAPAFCLPGERQRPPLGLLHIGAALRKAGFRVRLFDFQETRTCWEDVEAELGACRQPLVGFTCDSDSIFRVLRLSEKIRSRFPQAQIVLGGPHITQVGERYVAERRLVVRGDGELPMTLLAEHFLDGRGRLEDIPGLMFLGDGQICSNPVYRGSLEELNHLPCPDYTLLASREKYQPVMATSRGCPYRCHFCSEGSEQCGYRPRTIESIERELVALAQAFDGRLTFMGFADDTFTASPRRVIELCDMFDRVCPDKTRFSFFCEGRVNILGKHPELIYRLREAGMVRMQIGIEAGDQAALDRMNKSIRLEDIERVVDTCRRAGLPSVHGAFICGLPGQTEADVMNEIEYAKHLVEVGGGRLETSMVALSPLPRHGVPGPTLTNGGLRVLDGEFVSGGLIDGCFSETALLSKADIVRLCALFNATLDRYILEKASWSTPDEIKGHFALAADGRVYTWLLRKFICHVHMESLLDLRMRSHHRFLFEVAEAGRLDNAAAAPAPEPALARRRALGD